MSGHDRCHPAKVGIQIDHWRVTLKGLLDSRLKHAGMTRDI